ncbi:hypothetical protein M408DRAFT_27608 [Serendipita vermifera MAFF 305830]|uniref:Uncharacterized protein n=1 Tax=Serendipita vermifera MAFF 305830 TaxID=933852 RepID=A0A0C3AX08_SERVB|nr:hypothetical protein M408DRAFT_27608 [Serendipita vermifera MAFF 305830]
MHLNAKALWVAHTILAVVAASKTLQPPSSHTSPHQQDESLSTDFWEQPGQLIHRQGPEDDPQTSLALDPSQIQTAYASQGLNESDSGITPSLTSTNNFINFCLTQDVPLTNGTQVGRGSCSPTPMGRIVAKDKMPSCKFIYPKNGSLLPANTLFDVKLAIRNFESGLYSNPNISYYSAPQTTNDDGLLRGHAHFVIEAVADYLSETPLDPVDFTFFKSIKEVPVNGVVTSRVPNGIPSGIYRMSTITTAINHQPALVGVAQHGSLEDVVYFKVTDNAF